MFYDCESTSELTVDECCEFDVNYSNLVNTHYLSSSVKVYVKIQTDI